MHAFFHEFSKMGREQLYPENVIIPSTVEELGVIESAYESLGIPGAAGSMDVVHIALGAFPYALSNVCTGKEGFPSLGYNMICDHQGRELALMPGVYGRMNDKTIIKFDLSMDSVRTDKLFTDYMYEVHDEKGVRSMEKGVYVICDGGYLQWDVLQCGLKHSSDSGYNEWRKRVESVRKYIECYFGRLKKRFKILKTPNHFRKKFQIDNMMFTIVSIQNMILELNISSKEYQSWDVKLKWQKVNLYNNTLEENTNNLLQALEDEEQEDINEETGKYWFRPNIMKIRKRKIGINNAEDNNNYYEDGTDFSFIVLRGKYP